MALINVDFPQPLGPRIATCSPTPIFSETSRSATVWPRITVTRSNSIKGGDCVDTKPLVPDSDHIVIRRNHTAIKCFHKVSHGEQQRVPVKSRTERWR